MVEIKYETLKSDKHIKNGRYQYFLAGYLLTERTYQNNKKNGLWKYYCLDTSGVAFLGDYLDDVKVGKWFYYHHGKALSEIDYDGYGNMRQYYVFSSKGDTIFKGSHVESGKDSIVKTKLPGFTHDTIMPSFPGGIPVLMTFLSKTIQYPPLNTFTHPGGGEVRLSFIVNKNGLIQDIKIIKSLGEPYDDEAMHAVKLMPRWNPGIFDGLPEDVQNGLPIRFKQN